MPPRQGLIRVEPGGTRIGRVGSRPNRRFHLAIHCFHAGGGGACSAVDGVKVTTFPFASDARFLFRDLEEARTGSRAQTPSTGEFSTAIERATANEGGAAQRCSGRHCA